MYMSPAGLALLILPLVSLWAESSATIIQIFRSVLSVCVYVHCRYKRGYKNIINKGIELNKDGADCELMMETSGHGALRENRFLDDGAYMSVKLIIEAARRRWEGRPDIRYALLRTRPPFVSAIWSSALWCRSTGALNLCRSLLNRTVVT